MHKFDWLWNLLSGAGGAAVMFGVGLLVRNARDRQLAQSAADKAIAVIQTDIKNLYRLYSQVADSLQEIQLRSYRLRRGDYHPED